MSVAVPSNSPSGSVLSVSSPSGTLGDKAAGPDADDAVEEVALELAPQPVALARSTRCPLPRRQDHDVRAQSVHSSTRLTLLSLSGIACRRERAVIARSEGPETSMSDLCSICRPRDSRQRALIRSLWRRSLQPPAISRYGQRGGLKCHSILPR